MEQTKTASEKRTYYVSLPNLGYATRKSTNVYMWAVIARNRIPGGSWGEWYVARWSKGLALAYKYAKYLSYGCPSVKKGYYQFETKVVDVSLFE